MELHSEQVRSGMINGKMYSGFFTLLPDGQYMATVVGHETSENGFGEHHTEMCNSKEEAVATINEIWGKIGRAN
ncbi:hypothetical protein [Paenibacillus sp. PAMC 26794]|uniref:hypothetical protein n=1 Tax=Paenibacillus sp. PAMC 26794 TaxID=1257080 RepID=UPI00030EEE90|nr:hypothetical protein [Paenibacillus sp. PAMC 26794]